MKLHDAATEAAQAAPPVSVNAMALFGVPLANWVIILNSLYIIILIVYKLYKIWKETANGGK